MEKDILNSSELIEEQDEPEDEIELKNAIKIETDKGSDRLIRELYTEYNEHDLDDDEWKIQKYYNYTATIDKLKKNTTLDFWKHLKAE